MGMRGHEMTSKTTEQAGSFIHRPAPLNGDPAYFAPVWGPDPMRKTPRERIPAQIGQSVTWTEDCRQMRGQIWDRSGNSTNREQDMTGPLWWVAVDSRDAEFAGEMRTAAETADGWTVGFWQFTPAGRLARDG